MYFEICRARDVTLLRVHSMTAGKLRCSINSIYFNDIKKNTIVVSETFLFAIKNKRKNQTMADIIPR